jgi:hypothetical protein
MEGSLYSEQAQTSIEDSIPLTTSEGDDQKQKDEISSRFITNNPQAPPSSHEAPLTVLVKRRYSLRGSFSQPSKRRDSNQWKTQFSDSIKNSFEEGVFFRQDAVQYDGSTGAPVATPPLNLEELSSVEYLEIFRELSELEHPNEDGLLLQRGVPLRRRWRGLAPIPPQISPSTAMTQNAQALVQQSFDGEIGLISSNIEIIRADNQYFTKRDDPPLSSQTYPISAINTHYPLNNSYPLDDFDNNSHGSGGKEIRWKHQTDMLKNKFAKGGKNVRTSSRGSGSSGLSSIPSAKSFITKWKL